MLTEEEYKTEWAAGLHQTDYNNCRFAEDKLAYCKAWLAEYVPSYRNNTYEFLVTEACNQKIKIAEDLEYRNLCSVWSDKILVEQQLANIGLSDLIIPSIAKVKSFTNIQELIDLQANVDVIIKCNHGSGWNKILRSQDNEAIMQNILTSIHEWQFLNYAYIGGYEAQYENIDKGLIVQPMLAESLMDYCFWCINGKIKRIGLTKKLGKNLERYIAFVNPDGSASHQCIGMPPELYNLPNSLQQIIESMKEAVVKIASKFEFVRVDMYHVNGKNYFGETTFTPCGGKLVLSER